MIMCLGSGVFAGDEVQTGEFVNVNMKTGQETRFDMPNVSVYSNEVLKIEPVKYDNTIVPYSIIGDDGRTEMSTYDKRIVYIYTKFASGGIRSTGVLLGNGLVFTAGHAVIDNENGYGKAISITVRSFSAEGALAGEKSIAVNASNVIYNSNWGTGLDRDYDYALIKLSSNFPFGYFGTMLDTNSYVGKTLTITGYPKDADYRQLTMSGPITSNTALRMYYNIDTNGGQSGSPVYEFGDYVTAVHVESDLYLGNNAVRITKPIFDLITANK